MTEADVTWCDGQKILALLDGDSLSDAVIHQALMDSRIHGAGKKPSVETIFHAWLLQLPGIECVGHCHPVTVNQILCSPRAEEFGAGRILPDEIVCCGASSVFVPYADPGLPLAREIRDRTKEFIDRKGFVPRLILLQNHGIIALGRTTDAVLACLLMAAKAAEIFIGAAALGGPAFLSVGQVERIAGRADEAYRQKQLNI